MTIIGMADDRDEVLDNLMKLGVTQIVEQSDESEQAAENGHVRDLGSSNFAENVDTRKRIERTLTEIDRRYPKKTPAFSGKPSVTEDEFNMTAEAEQKALTLLRKYESSVEKENELRSELSTVRQRMDELEAWADIPIDLTKRETEKTRILYGTIRDQNKLESFLDEIREDKLNAVVFQLKETESQASLLAIVAIKEDVSHIRSRLSAYEFTPIPDQAIVGTALDSLDNLEKREIDLEGLIRDETIKQKEVSEERRVLMIYHDVLLVKADKEIAEKDIASTQYTFYLYAWVDSDKAEMVKDSLTANFDLLCNYRPAEKDEKHPIILKNNEFNKSFEVVLEMYGSPSYDEADPTPVMAPFYMIVFGMMLSDVGYGLLLLIICMIFLKKDKAKGKLYNMSRMLSLSAVASIIWGFVFGGFFGNFITALSDGALNFPTLWFDPMQDPISLLVFSLFFGIIHLFAGMAMDIKNKALKGDLIGGLLDQVPWYLTITAIVLLLLEPLELVSDPATIATLKNIGKWMIYVSLGVVVVFAGRGGSWNPLVRIGKAFIAIYNNLTGFLSDILSYSRILALVLATSVIAQVVNILATGGSGFSFVIKLILIGGIGHALNLALSALSAFVHASRLQYVEFFGMFFEGAGEYFKPFKRDTKYVDVKSNVVETEKSN